MVNNLPRMVSTYCIDHAWAIWLIMFVMFSAVFRRAFLRSLRRDLIPTSARYRRAGSWAFSPTSHTPSQSRSRASSCTCSAL